MYGVPGEQTVGAWCAACCRDDADHDSDMHDGGGENSRLYLYDEEPVDGYSYRGFHAASASSSQVGARPVIAKKAPPTVNASDELVERPEVEVDGSGRYRGQWRGSMPHGHGVLVRADGQRYEGAFQDARAHGRGKFESPTGNTYVGQWANDEKTGKGIETWPDGARYEGEFGKGLKHGVGIYRSGAGTDTPGIHYEGQFRDDWMDGEGCYRFADQRIFIGQWQLGRMSGQGKMEWPDGSRYEGYFWEDMKHGEGTFTWTDGRKYIGQWAKGKQDGTGLTADATGRKGRPTSWRNGVQIS